MLFCSFSYAVGKAAVLGTTSVFKQGGLDQGILASQVPHFNRAKRCGRAAEGCPFLFCLAGYVTGSLFTCTQTPEIMLAFVFLANFFLQVSSDWIISLGMPLKTAFLSWEFEVPQGLEGSQQSLPRQLFKIDLYLTREFFSSLSSW